MATPCEYQFSDGYYKVKAGFFKLLRVESGVLRYHNEVRDITRTVQVEYGDFGPAEEEIVQQCGARRYNIRLSHGLEMGTAQELGVISRDGRKAIVKSFMGTYQLEWVAEDQATEEETDPLEAPPGPYIVQPGQQGVLVWLTGAPGMGKSTTAQNLSRHKVTISKALWSPVLTLSSPGLCLLRGRLFCCPEKSLHSPGGDQPHPGSVQPEIPGRARPGGEEGGEPGGGKDLRPDHQGRLRGPGVARHEDLPLSPV